VENASGDPVVRAGLSEDRRTEQHAVGLEHAGDVRDRQRLARHRPRQTVQDRLSAERCLRPKE